MEMKVEFIRTYDDTNSEVRLTCTNNMPTPQLKEALCYFLYQIGCLEVERMKEIKEQQTEPQTEQIAQEAPNVE